MCSIVLVCLPSADEYANSHNESGIIIDRTGRTEQLARPVHSINIGSTQIPAMPMAN